jgi:hypothetical protein
MPNGHTAEMSGIGLDLEALSVCACEDDLVGLANVTTFTDDHVAE